MSQQDYDAQGKPKPANLTEKAPAANTIPSKAEIRQKLTDEEFFVTQQNGTEMPFTGEFWNHHEKGAYECKVCGTMLFDSNTKFESGSGWPSFDQPANLNHVKLIEDDTHGMHRTEVRCKKCDAHLGHLFPDGPTKTGERYCINSCSLNFKKQ